MRRVLIAEDEGIVAEEIRERVQNMGLAVVGVVASAEQAVEAAGRTRPDVILMDIRLQGEMDGIEAITRIQKQIEAPVIYLTAHSDAETVNRARHTAPSAYLIKPFDERSLQIAIQLAVDGSQAARARRAREERFLAALLASDAGVIAADTAGRIVFMNPAAESLIGWSASDAFGHALDEVVRLIDLPSRQSFWNVVAHVRRNDTTPPARFAAELITRHGAVVMVEVVLTSARDSRGVYGSVSIVRPVAASRAVQATPARPSGQNHIDTVARLAAGVAHNMNNLMTVVIGCADLLLRDASDDAGARDVQLVREIRDAGRRAAAVTGQLLAFSRQQTLAPTVCDLNDVVWECEPRLRELVGGGVDVVVVVAPHPCPVLVDRRQIEQVIVNLTMNAREAMPSGGRFSIETRRSVLDDAPAARQGDDVRAHYVVLTLTDTGIGMDRETQARLFEPFFTTRPAAEGRGLGLSTAHGIVAQSGGFILVHTEPGQGTRFDIYLPEQASFPVSRFPQV